MLATGRSYLENEMETIHFSPRAIRQAVVVHGMATESGADHGNASVLGSQRETFTLRKRLDASAMLTMSRISTVFTPAVALSPPT